MRYRGHDIITWDPHTTRQVGSVLLVPTTIGDLTTSLPVLYF